MTLSEKKARIPTFRGDQEERDFRARQSVEEFAKDLTDLQIEIGPPVDPTTPRPIPKTMPGQAPGRLP